MKRFLEGLIGKRKIVLFITTLVALFGLYSYNVVPKQENPDVSGPIAVITTIYPGASAEEVEMLVTSKIEDEAEEVEDLDYVSSISKKGVSVVRVFLKMNLSSEEVNKRWIELDDNIASIEGELPDGAFRPSINKKMSETTGMMIGLYGMSTAMSS